MSSRFSRCVPSRCMTLLVQYGIPARLYHRFGRPTDGRIYSAGSVQFPSQYRVQYCSWKTNERADLLCWRRSVSFLPSCASRCFRLRSAEKRGVCFFFLRVAFHFCAWHYSFVFLRNRRATDKPPPPPRQNKNGAKKNESAQNFLWRTE